ncbi:MAG TPA: low affinity iron permease family protein [Polyangia bacterium]|nr:low affinity iron permease family protein [Polyangia bacterium]
MNQHDEPPRPHKSGSDRFRILASHASQKLGSHWAFLGAVVVVLLWLVTGPVFHFSNAWQLVINTGTTVVTFLMVFLIQATQNRDAKALHLKLDELIRSSRARNVFADLEDATEDELVAFKEEFRKLREQGLQAEEAAEVAHRATHQPAGGERREQRAPPTSTSRTPRAP